MGFLDRFKRKKRLPGGGGGLTQEDAIVITAQNTFQGVAAEYAHVARLCGRRDVDWHLLHQRLTNETGGGRRYDVLVVRLSSGEVREYWFDITQFFGRF